MQMKPSIIQPDIHELIESHDFVTLKKAVADMEVHDQAALLSELEGEDLAMVFRLLPQQRAVEVFGDLPVEDREELVGELSTQKVVDIVNEMPPDERTELLEELPGELAKQLLGSLTRDELQVARALLAYPEDSIGRLMTPEYVAVSKAWTVGEVFDHIRHVGHGKETLHVIYVVDDRGRLVDDLRLEQLVLADPAQPIGSLMDEQFACLQASDDRETAGEVFRKYDAIALPVVNKQGVLVGIVTVDDVLDVVAEENTEDFQMMAGVEALESPYFDTPFLQMIRKRLPWLVMLLLAETLTVVALSSFEKLEIIDLAVLAIFVPLINSPAGNAGSQMAGLVIRGLAIREMETHDWRRVLVREILLGLALGVVLGLLGYPTALLFGRPPAVAIAVGLAIGLAVLLANFLGAMLPFFFQRIGLDPAVTSGPFLASLMDVFATLIYFSIAIVTLKMAAG